MAERRRISRRELDRALGLSVFDGALYAVMAGFSEAYFLADAVRLGATSIEQGLVVTLPLLGGGLGSLLAVRLLGRARRRKGIVVAGVAAQVAVLVLLSLLHVLGTPSVGLLLLLATINQVAAQTAGVGWSSWFGDLVPGRIRGRYFGMRSRFVYASTLASLVLSGLVLQRAEPGAAGAVAHGAGGQGFAIVFVVAALARIASGTLLLLTPEPTFRGLSGAAEVRGFLKAGRGRAAGRLLLAAAGMQFLVYLGSPYFSPYMLDELQFSYVEYMAASVAVVLAKIVVLPSWGRAVDQHGGRSVLLLVGVLVALVPLPWIWARGLGWVLAAQAFSGFAWSGYEVSFFSLMLETTSRRVRPHAFAALSLLNGSAQFLGGLAGGLLLGALDRDFRLLFAVGVVARLGLGVMLPRVVPAIPTRPGVGRRALLLRVVGLRPHGGIAHRPVLGPGDEMETFSPPP